MDDEPVIRNLLAEMLNASGFHVVLSGDGNEVLHLFNQYQQQGVPFDGIILDLTIPGGMGGRETILEIRKSDTKVPVIVSSGYSEDPIVQHPEKYGFSASIKKPFVRKELIALLAKHLGNLPAE
jgi:CheY-like chemotaxis protein